MQPQRKSWLRLCPPSIPVYATDTRHDIGVARGCNPEIEHIGLMSGTSFFYGQLIAFEKQSHKRNYKPGAGAGPVTCFNPLSVYVDALNHAHSGLSTAAPLSLPGQIQNLLNVCLDCAVPSLSLVVRRGEASRRNIGNYITCIIIVIISIIISSSSSSSGVALLV